MRLYSVID